MVLCWAMDTQEPNLAHELVTDLKALAEEAGTLVEDVVTGKPTEDAIATLKAQFEVAQSRFADICGEAKQKVVEAKNSADQSVRENPYQALAIVAGVGFIAGLLVGRVSRR